MDEGIPKKGKEINRREFLKNAAATAAVLLDSETISAAETQEQTLATMTPDKVHELQGHWIQVRNLLRQELPVPRWKEALGSPRGLVVSKRFHRFWLFDNGDLVKTHVVGTGKPDHETPEGKFQVAWEKGRNYSSGEFPASDPDEPNMPWAVFTNAKNEEGEYRGIAFHGSPQRFHKNEDGVLFLLLDASHGCINATVEDAELVNKTLRSGDPITIVP